MSRGYVEPRVIISRVLAVIVALVLVIFVGRLIYLDQLTVVMLNSTGTRALFGCTVAEFPDQEFDFYEETGDLRRYALIDELGAGGKSLRLSVPPWKCDDLAESDWLSAREELAQLSHVELRLEKREIRIVSSERSLNAVWEADEQLLNRILMKAYFAQIFSGVDQGLVRMKIVLVSPLTGETVASQDCYYLD